MCRCSPTRSARFIIPGKRLGLIGCRGFQGGCIVRRSCRRDAGEFFSFGLVGWLGLLQSWVCYCIVVLVSGVMLE